MPLARAEDALARLDERLAKSPIRDGWIARGPTSPTPRPRSGSRASSSMSRTSCCTTPTGTSVHPPHELIRAHARSRTRRRIAAAEPDWAFSDAGLAGLRGRARETGQGAAGAKSSGAGGLDEGTDDEALDGFEVAEDPYDPLFADAFAAVDAAMARASRTVADDRVQQALWERDPLTHDPDWDEDARLGEWLSAQEETRALPATLEAAILLEAWRRSRRCSARPGSDGSCGRRLRSARQDARPSSCLHDGFRAIPFERRRSRDPTTRLVIALEAMAAAARVGLEAHDRWLMARTVLTRKLAGRRPSSHLPALDRLCPDLGRSSRPAWSRRNSGSRRARRRRWSPSSACARRPDGGAIGPGASCRGNERHRGSRSPDSGAHTSGADGCSRLETRPSRRRL